MATAQQLRERLDGALAHLTPHERLELGALLINEGLAAMAASPLRMRGHHRATGDVSRDSKPQPQVRLSCRL